MKSYRINREKMLSHDNIEQSFLNPSRGKRDRSDIKKVLDNLEDEIKKVYEMLNSNDFHPRKHNPVIINEKNYLKEREIIKPDYCYEQVVHHVIIRSIHKSIERGMYTYVLGSIPKRGAHKGKKVIEKWIRRDPANTKYVLKMDIRHFFASIDHEILKNWLKKKFRDEFILDLLSQIIDATETGLPLGYYTSQWFANFLLQPLDHYIKETLHVKYMTRYMDDIVCFGRNKKELHKAHLKIEKYLKDELSLNIKGDWQVFRLEYETEEYAITCRSLAELYALNDELETGRIRHKLKKHKKKLKIFVNTASVKSKTKLLTDLLNHYKASYEIIKTKHGRALDYMGFEFHRGYTVIRKSIMIRMMRKVRVISRQERINPKDAQALLSYMGWIKHTDTYGMYEALIKPDINIKKLKRIVSKEQKRRDQNERMETGRRNTAAETAGT